MGDGDSWEWLAVSGAWAEEWKRSVQSPFLNISQALATAYPAFAIDPTTPWPCADNKRTVPVNPGGSQPWNPPTEKTLAPGQTVSYALRFTLVGGHNSDGGSSAGYAKNKNKNENKNDSNNIKSNNGKSGSDGDDEGYGTVVHDENTIGTGLGEQQKARANGNNGNSNGNNNINVRGSELGPRARNVALSAMGEPVIHGVPGYVLGTDMKSALLLVKPPRGARVTGVQTVTVSGDGHLAFIDVAKANSTPAGDGFIKLEIIAISGQGRARANVHYSDGTQSSVHYFIVPPFTTQVSKFGAHLADVAWLPRDYPDPFGRSASVMPWDRSPCQGPLGNSSSPPCGHVLNDARAYDVGLSDDAGGGNPLAMASRVRAGPTQHEASRIDE
eukprot:UC1_evm1s1333